MSTPVRLEAQVHEGVISIAGIEVGLQARVFVHEGEIVAVRSLRLVGDLGHALPVFDDGTIDWPPELLV